MDVVYKRMMRLSLVLVVAFFGFVGTAHAKSLTGLEVCGESDCASLAMSGFHRSPFDDETAGQLPPAVGPFYRIVFEVDRHRENAWRVYYEPRSGLGAVFTEFGSTMWLRVDEELALIAKRLARKLAPFPAPPVDSVTIGGRTVAGDPRTYLQLFARANQSDRPLSHETVPIRIDSPLPNPWTEQPLLRYYPEEKIVQLGLASFTRLDADLAADVEAARELGAGGSGFPWATVAGAIAAVALAAVAVVWWPGRRLVRPKAASQ
jgi:hypothetical protein